ALFLEEALEPGRPAADSIAEARRQGALVGIPHPFDRYRGSLLRDERMAGLAPLVDWVETHNARIMVGPGKYQAAALAGGHRLPGGARAGRGACRLHAARRRPVRRRGPAPGVAHSRARSRPRDVLRSWRHTAGE